MALSDSQNYSQNRNSIIYDAMSLVGTYSEGETPSSFDVEQAARAFNRMLKAWHAKGFHLWTRKTKSFTLVSGTASYTLGPSGTVSMYRPTRVLSVTLKETSSGSETELTPMSKDEYHKTPLKTTASRPTAYCYDPQLTNGVLYFWPVVDATGYTAEVLYVKPFDDLDNSTDDIEVPAEWLETVVYALASRLSDIEKIPLNERGWLRNISKEMLDELNSFDVENVSLFFQPDI